MLFWKHTRVLVTGGDGFIGRFVAGDLVRLGADVTVMSRSVNAQAVPGGVKILNGDCANPHDAGAACKDKDVVFNLAAHVGGIRFNRAHKATMIHDNTLIALTMLEAARIRKVERFLEVSTACVYPSDVSIPTPETEGFRGDPEETEAGYGWSKRVAELAAGYYSEQYGMKIGIVRPYNAYGPGDHFDNPDGHVIPSLISRIIRGEDPLVVWGSGNQTRSFIYTGDLAKGMIRAIEIYPKPDAINLGSDEEISIRNVVSMICEIAGKHPKIMFDTSKPDGSIRRKSDNTKAKTLLGFTATTQLRSGLEKTIDWYVRNLTK